MKNTVIFCLLAFVSSHCYAVLLGVDEFDMISISADEAEEDERPGILHFKGNFLMQSRDWRLTSTQATVYGSPDRPDRVRLEGSPARFHVRQDSSSEPELVEAAAMVVEYVRATSKLSLTGNATLVLDREIIQSAEIEYDIETRRYRAGGGDGVLIVVPPTSSSATPSPPVGH
jgi:lipopolysaccharide transport protein LptA